MTELGMNMDESTLGGVSRRRVLQGAAWSVPAVMVAQMPVWASNGTPPDIQIDFGASTACKVPGTSWGSLGYSKGYVLWALVDNKSGPDVLVTGVAPGSFKVNNIVQCFVGLVDPAELCDPPTSSESVLVPAGQSRYIGFFSDSDTESASNVPVELILTYESGGESLTTPILDSAQQGEYFTGSPWTTGGGSCEFPPTVCGAVKDREPPSAVGLC